MPRVDVVDVSKNFGAIQALDEVNLTVDDGSYVCFLGPSGCGKTTLLRIIAGFIEPDEGDVYIDGRSMKGIPPEKRGIGFVFQDIALFPHMRLVDNVSFGPEVRRWRYKDSLKTALLNLRRVGVDIDRSVYPAEVSGGIAQLVSVARALAVGSKLLLLDEPLGALDPKMRVYMKYRLREVVKSFGLTAIHVTHDQDEALSIADKIVVMRRGRIIQTGSPKELYWKPESLFVAYFVGEANIVEAVARRSGGLYIADLDGAKLVCGWVPSLIEEGKRAILAVRPEAFRIVYEATEKNTLRVEVSSARRIGRALHLDFMLPDGTHMKAKVWSDIDVEPGSWIHVKVAEYGCFLYPYPKEGLEEEVSPV
ncbi:MAG: ABC transporter ATP-binding protein [Candidatus Bathyarchaeia archaeon]